MAQGTNVIKATDSPGNVVSGSEKGPSNFTGVDKYPPLHQAGCLFKWLLLVWDQWVWGNLEWISEWTTFSQASQRDDLLIHSVLPFKFRNKKNKRENRLIKLFYISSVVFNSGPKSSPGVPTNFRLIKLIFLLLWIIKWLLQDYIWTNYE